MTAITYSNWFPGQLVEQTDMLAATDDIYQRLTAMYADRPLPYLVNGLTVSINSTGLVTVASGVAIDNPFNQSDYPSLPADNLASVGQLVGSGTCQVTAVGPEYGIVVLRQTITPTSPGETLYTIVSTLVYTAGSSTAYPTIGDHDIPLIGVITSGTSPSQTYLLDYNERAVDSTSYAATVRATPYLTNTHFDAWQFGLGPFNSNGPTGVQTSNDWYISTDAVTPITAQQYTLTSLESASIPNTPTYGLQINRATGGSGDPDNIYQFVQSYQLQNYQALNGKYVVFSIWAKLTATDDMTVSFFLDYSNNGNPGDPYTAIPQTETTFTVPADDTFHLYSFAVWVPNLLTTPGVGTDNAIAVNWYITNNQNVPYTMIITEGYLQSGKYYIVPETELARGADTPILGFVQDSLALTGSTTFEVMNTSNAPISTDGQTIASIPFTPQLPSSTLKLEVYVPYVNVPAGGQAVLWFYDMTEDVFLGGTIFGVTTGDWVGPCYFTTQMDSFAGARTIKAAIGYAVNAATLNPILGFNQVSVVTITEMLSDT